MPKKIKILIVDSDIDLLSRLYLTLLHKGYKVEATNEAEEIIARIDRFRPNLLVINDFMDGLTGEILRDLYKRKIAVLLITDSDEFSSEHRFRKMEIIHRPVDLLLLDLKIKELMNIVA
ncbi:MAG TPA: hypothetical protein VFQ58_07350 [Flavisolibacter sp.]|jgi:DNA-binding response OmpR family regulator|nr:hypothetical protein [Flavisolibacter sp.]